MVAERAAHQQDFRWKTAALLDQAVGETGSETEWDRKWNELGVLAGDQIPEVPERSRSTLPINGVGLQ